MDRMDYEKAVNTYATMVYRIAFSYTNSKYDAEDILQEVFLKLLQTSTNFSNEEHVKHWLVRVTINQGKNLHKSFWKRNVEVSEPGTFELEWKEEREKRLYEEHPVDPFSSCPQSLPASESFPMSQLFA